MNPPMPKRLILLLAVLAVLFLASIVILYHGAQSLHIGIGSLGARRVQAWLIESLPWAGACAAAFCWSRLVTNMSSRKTQLVLTGAVALIASLWLTLQPLAYSFDVLRYLWNGRLMVHGINPYRYIPADPHLAALRHWTYWHPMAWKQWPEAYPPFAQLYFWLAAWVTNGTITAYKLLVFLNGWVANALFLHLLVVRRRANGNQTGYLSTLTQRDLQALALWLLLPPVLVESFGSGHVDAFAVPWRLWAWLAALQKRPLQLGIAIGLATAIKLFPIVLLIAFWRRGDWRGIARSLAACLVTVVVVSLPFLGNPHGLTAYYQHMLAYNGSIDYVLAKGFGNGVIAHSTWIVAMLWLAFAAHFTYDDLPGDMWIEYLPTYAFYLWTWVRASRGIIVSNTG